MYAQRNNKDKKIYSIINNRKKPDINWKYQHLTDPFISIFKEIYEDYPKDLIGGNYRVPKIKKKD
jgi:hypothetical protein